jgi:hypothetical protein
MTSNDNGRAALAAALRAILSDFDREPDDEYMAVAVPMFLSLLPNGYTKDIARELDLVQRLARSEHTIATLRAALDDQYRETPPCPFCGHREHRDDICEQDLGEHGECQCADTRPRSDSDIVRAAYDRLDAVNIEQAATIATLRAALDGLVIWRDGVPYFRTENGVPMEMSRKQRAALATVKEAGG